jgi:tripartite-type tricarboxylate transporter receptor subunit TctC
MLVRGIKETGLVLFALLSLGGRPALSQQSEASYYKDKTVRLIVGYASGGYDIYARLIAPYLAKTLGATVIVENQPGAGGLTALDNLAVAPPDGLRIMIVNGSGAALSQLIGLRGVRYDLAKMNFLATVGGTPRVWLASPSSPVHSPQDAMKSPRPLIWAAGGPIDGLSDGAAFNCAALALKCKIVMGYPGSAQAALALRKGEADALNIADTSAYSYVEAGDARPVATIAHERSRFFPETPTIFQSMPLTPDQAALFDYKATVDGLGRILVAPPGLPHALLAYLQSAVKTALTDPALIAQGEKTKLFIGYVDPESTQAAALKAVRSPSEAQRRFIADLLQRNG